ncbi:hypothetical protein PR202_gb18586 [Eleusine coracana subsp. coracana]|uniref:DUF1618 domain-containing protein n=1 Tax=Eleusine coracana subsp. coracana TaxID=191504 RepID=A0AAV5F6L4_ELECO|nr:hypothetical protein PR202_gb18586 [Eleusine coracana subsp. coracana]
MDNRQLFCASSFNSPPLLVAVGGATTSRRRSHSPDFVLLDKVAYLADRRNGTTAEAFGRAGQSVQVSFWFADPPGLSHLCVHCPGLKKTDFAEEPRIVCAEKNIAILHICFSFGPKDDVYEKGLRDYFVYRAHPEHPSLDLLHNPSPHTFRPHEFGLLPCVGGSQKFLIAVLRHKMVCPGEYDLHVFSSETWTWSTKVALLDPQAPRTWGKYLIHVTDKVITLLRDTLAFIDLWNGILLCPMRQDIPDLRYIGLPESISRERNTEKNPSATRNVSFSHGLIKFIEVAYRKRTSAPMCSICMCSTIDTKDYCNVYDGWDAITWKRSTFSDRWEKDCTPAKR